MSRDMISVGVPIGAVSVGAVSMGAPVGESLIAEGKGDEAPPSMPQPQGSARAPLAGYIARAHPGVPAAHLESPERLGAPVWYAGGQPIGGAP